MGSDKKFIYNSGIADEEIQWEIDDFRAQYPETWWTVEQIIILRLDTTGRLNCRRPLLFFIGHRGMNPIYNEA